LANGHEQLSHISRTIIGCAYKVSNTLGCGFLEKVYENAVAFELRRAGLKTVQQQATAVAYEGVVVGDYVADIVVEGRVIVELKAAKTLDDIHVAQCLNYLKATRMGLCLLINFGVPRIQIRRFVL